jgi:hypothetical protein
MKTSPHLRALLVTALVAQLFGSASAQKAATPVDPRIPEGSYTSEREAEVLAQFNAMQGLQKSVGTPTYAPIKSPFTNTASLLIVAKISQEAAITSRTLGHSTPKCWNWLLNTAHPRRKSGSLRPNTSLERTREG